MDVQAEDIVWKFAPNARPEYEAAFIAGEALLNENGVVTPVRLAHFMAQVMNETGGLRTLIENGRYTAKNLGDMWDGGNWHKYFADRNGCIAMAGQCAADDGKALFSLVYGDRMGNGASASGDGWTYRGRGLLQTTGREAYRKYGKRCGVDFEGHPDLIFATEHALKPALAEWRDGGLNALADAGDIVKITRRINGGTIGLEERRAWFSRIFPFAQAGVTSAWRVQAKLYKKKLLADRPDGVIGRNSRAAIKAWRQQAGLPAGENVDQALLASLGIG